ATPDLGHGRASSTTGAGAARRLGPRSVERLEHQCGGDRPAPREHEAVVLARPVLKLAVADERRRAAAVEVDRARRAQLHEHVGQLRECEPGLVRGAAVAYDGDQAPATE